MTDKERREANAKKREMRSRIRAAKREKRDLLQSATSTEDRREIKAYAEGKIFDINTSYRQDENKQGTDTRIQNDGIDKIEPSDGSGSGSGVPDGYEETEIIFNQSGTLYNATILMALGSAI